MDDGFCYSEFRDLPTAGYQLLTEMMKPHAWVMLFRIKKGRGKYGSIFEHATVAQENRKYELKNLIQSQLNTTAIGDG